MGGVVEVDVVGFVGGDVEVQWIVLYIVCVIGLVFDVVFVLELRWVFRCLFEWAAQWWPLIVVVEDIYWVELILLELVEHVVGHVGGVLLLLVCFVRQLFEWLLLGDVVELVLLVPVDLVRLFDWLDPVLVDDVDGRVCVLVCVEGNLFYFE